MLGPVRKDPEAVGVAAVETTVAAMIAAETGEAATTLGARRAIVVVRRAQ